MRTPACVLAAVAAATLSGAPAHALILSAVTDNGNFVDTSFTTMPGVVPPHVGVDVQFTSLAPVSVDFLLEQADLADGSASFNSLVSDLIGGTGLPSLRLVLTNGATFVLGSLTDINSGTPVVTLLDADAQALIAPAAGVSEIYIGDPFLEGLVDWRIAFSGLRAGDAFTLSFVPVAQPGSLALLALGIGLLGSVRRWSRR